MNLLTLKYSNQVCQSPLIVVSFMFLVSAYLDIVVFNPPSTLVNRENLVHNTINFNFYYNNWTKDTHNSQLKLNFLDLKAVGFTIYMADKRPIPSCGVS